MAYTNKTANYELPQYVPTDQPTYLEDFNGAMFTIDSGMKENSDNIGDLSSLTTTAKTNLVSAVNEVNQNSGASLIGDLSNLTTTEKSTVVGAINEVDSNTDTNATAIGTLSSLTTTAKTDLVSAINEVDGNTDTNSTSIGDLTSLTTTTKTDLVSAINEVASSSGGSCKLHFLDVSSYGLNNPLYFDTLELGSYVLYDSRQNYGSNNPISITFKGRTGSTGSATVSTYEGAILNYFIDINDITSTSKYFASCSFIGGSSSAPSLNYFTFKLSNTSTGRIDYTIVSSVVLTYANKSNIANNFNSSAIQYLKNVNGTLNWVTEANITPSMLYLGKINTYNSQNNALDLSSYPAGTRIVLKHNDSSRGFYLKVGSNTALVTVTTDNDEAILNNIYYVDVNSISGSTANIAVVWASTYEWCPIVTNTIMVSFASGGATVGNNTRNMQVLPYFQIEEDSSGNLNATTLQQFINIREIGITKTKAQQRTAIQYVDKNRNNILLTYKSHTSGAQQVYEGTGILKSASTNGLYEAYRITLEINYSGITYTNYQVSKTSLGFVFNPTAITGYSATGTRQLQLNNGTLEWT